MPCGNYTSKGRMYFPARMGKASNAGAEARILRHSYGSHPFLFKEALRYVVASSPRRGENTAFFPVFPSMRGTVKAFFRLIRWNFREKSINNFYGTTFRTPFPAPLLTYPPGNGRTLRGRGRCALSGGCAGQGRPSLSLSLSHFSVDGLDG